MTNQSVTVECSNCGCGCSACSPSYTFDLTQWLSGVCTPLAPYVRLCCSTSPVFGIVYSGGDPFVPVYDCPGNDQTFTISVKHVPQSGWSMVLNESSFNPVFYMYPYSGETCPPSGPYVPQFPSPGLPAQLFIEPSDEPCGAPPPSEMPCCTEGGCIITTASNCQATGGTPRPDLLSCGGNPCTAPPIIGACCFVNNSCSQLTAAQCTQAGGVSWHANVLCNPLPCGGGQLGACCFGSLCSMMTQNDCALMKGFFGGVGTACTSQRCVTGCCDYGNGNCAQTYAGGCHGTFYPNIHCPPTCQIGHSATGFPVVHDESDFARLDVGVKFIDAETGDILEKTE